MTKDIALALVDTIAKAVSKEGITSETLCFLDEEAESEGSGWIVKGRGRTG
jgi:hypothetical protein